MICVTGAAGYLGDPVVKLALEYCEKREATVLAIDKLLYGGRYDREHPNLVFARCDVRDTKRLRDLFIQHNIKAVIHLAALVGDGACAVNPPLTVDINETATKNLAALCTELGIRLVFASTCSVYGAADKLLDEESSTNPLSLYAGTKLNAEEAVRQVPEHFIFRLGTLFGRSAEFGRLRCDLVVNVLTIKAVEGKKLTIFGGQQWRPLLHVRDAAHMMVRAAVTAVVPCGTYNLARGNYTIIEIGRAILETLGVAETPSSFEITEQKFEDLRNYCVSTKKATTRGFIPVLDLSDGIKEIAAKVRSGSVADVWDNVYHNEKFLKVLYETVPN